MFPIHNNTGDVIAFGGRILESSDIGGKYVNSPGTELYTKGKSFTDFIKQVQHQQDGLLGGVRGIL
jgi:DNA primase